MHDSKEDWERSRTEDINPTREQCRHMVAGRNLDEFDANSTSLKEAELVGDVDG